MRLILLTVVISLCSCTRTIYVVRHAEKAVVPSNADRMMASDPPLSPAGEARAQSLATLLAGKKIRTIYSTPYKRTVLTVQPIANGNGIPIISYKPSKDSTDALLERVLSEKKGNVLIAGHSNTVDDIANKLAGKVVVPADLPDSVYNNIFILRQRGKKVSFEKMTY